MASVDISAVQTSFGSFYRNEGQGMKDLMKQIMIPGNTDRIFNLRPTKNTQERKVHVDISGTVFQKFQNVLSPAGAFAFTPRQIDLQDAKYEVKLEDMDDLESSWLAFLAAEDGNDRATWPFIQWIVNEMAIAKGRQDFELYEVYAGVFTSITTPGTATPAGENFTGLNSLLRGYADEGSSNIIPFGTPETDPQYFYEQVNDWIYSCKTDAIKKKIVETMCDRLCMSPELAERYGDGKDKALNTNYFRSADANIDNPVIEVRAKRSNIIVTGLDSMTGTEDLFMTMKDNRAAFVKRPKGETEFGINMANPYAPILFAKFWKGIGFWFPQYIWTNVTND
jgi:hypothetical protein